MTAHTRAQLHDFEWRMTRDQAQRVQCPRCRAGPGQPCRNPITDEELRAPAHFQRIDAAKEQT